MSKHIQKYPGLWARCKGSRTSYQVMYMRCRGGMTVDEAFAKPVGRCGRKPGVKQGPRKPPLETAKYVWQRPAWKPYTPPVDRSTGTPTRKRRSANSAPSEAPTRKRRSANSAPSEAPRRIQKLLAAYCNHFIKTGELDVTMGKQLKDYADEQRTVTRNSNRVPDEPAARRDGGKASDVLDDSGRDGHQVERGTAERIADYLRTF